MKLKAQSSKLKTIVIFAAFVLLMAGCQPKIERAKPNGVIPVKVARVEIKELNEILEYAGDIKAQGEVLVYPKVSGKIIQKVKEDGSPINKGDVIAYIDRDEVGLKFEKAPVESPLTGVVGRVYVDIGSNVSAQTPVALVVDMDKVKIIFSAPEKYISRITVGQEAKIRVDAYPQEEFLGQVIRVSPVVDVDTRSVPIEIMVDNAGHRLNSGMFAKVNLILDKNKKAPAILKEAVMGKAPNAYVYVVENKKAVLRNVNLGIRQGPYYEVVDGLKEGEFVVIMGQQRLRDGSQVEPEE